MSDDIDWEDVDLESPPSPVEKKLDIGDAELDTIDMSAFDNVHVEIPSKVDIPEKTKAKKTIPLTEKEKDILKNLENDDTEDLQEMMDDKKKLMNRLQTDPEFDKRFKKAERAYVAKIHGEEPPNDDIPDDALYKQAQTLVQKIHVKSLPTEKIESSQKDVDPHGLSRFGTVTDEVPSDEVTLDDIISSGGNRPIIYIANVSNLVINVHK